MNWQDRHIVNSMLTTDPPVNPGVLRGLMGL